jgi:tetratricopeptide (TPR) repeat protein
MYGNLGNALALQGRLKEAGEYYAKALQIVPSAAIHYNWAIALARDGNTREAIRHLQDALKLDPGFQPARRALGDLTSSGKK